MKKMIALMLSLVLVLGMSVAVYAEEEPTASMTLTAEIPAPTYTIHIPADYTLEYGNTELQSLGIVYVTDVSGLNKISVKAPYDDLINTADSTDTIPLELYEHYENYNTPKLVKKNGLDESNARPIAYEKGVDHNTYPNFDENGYSNIEYFAKVGDWSGATAGATYQATVTFSFRIVI